MIDDASEIPYEELNGICVLGISAGASAPEYLVDDVVNDLKYHYDNVKILSDIVIKEEVSFKERRS